MKTKALFVLLLLALTIIIPTGHINAQDLDPLIVGSTVPTGPDLIAAVEGWLRENRPAETRFYAVTYAESNYSGVYICLVGLNVDAPEAEWNIEDNSTWFGTLFIGAGGGIDLYTDHGGGGNKLAAMQSGAGGGSYLRFPWQGGKGMVFGWRGVHAKNNFDNDGFWAVNFEGGAAIGSNIADSRVFAVSNGEIDWICDDGVSKAVRLYNGTTGDSFVYAHFVDHASLTIEQTFEKGDVIAGLKEGSFIGLGCGGAVQQRTNYNLFFMFLPQPGPNGRTIFQMEGCILEFTDVAGLAFDPFWMCGSHKVGRGAPLFSNASDPIGEDDPGDGSDRSSGWLGVGNFFDMVVGGMVRVATMPLTLMPEPNSSYWTFRDNVINTVLILLKITRVLFMGNFSVGLFMATISFFLTMEIGTFLIRIFIKLARLIANIVKLVG